MRNDSQARARRTHLFYGGMALVFLAVGVYLFLALRPLFLPALVGFLAAYLCVPLMKRLGRMGFSQYASLGVLFVAFLLVIAVGIRLVALVIPDEDDRVELRVVAQYNLNDRYDRMMGLAGEGDGNLLHSLLAADLDPLMEEVNRVLRLRPDERARFEEALNAGRLRNERAGELYSALRERFPDAVEGDDGMEAVAGSVPDAERSAREQGLLPRLLETLSIWLVMPFVFVFGLLDNGRMRKWLVGIVPNAYFEMALTTLHNIDRAIGRYLRGTVIECTLVGASLFLLLVLLGFDPTVAFLLGLVAGVVNVVPLIGPVVGLVAVAAYAVMIDEPGSVLPFVHSGTILVWAVLAVAVVQVLDNSIFKPFVLGRAVDLHPVIVVFVAIGGAAVAGFLGMLLAVPAVVVLKVLVNTVHSQLKEYYLIY